MQNTQARLPLGNTARRDDWHLDDHTREVGRKGLAEARAALAEAARRGARRDAERASKAAA